jgi:hypothetical protein
MDYKARFYDSSLGRFIQPDTIIPDMSNPQAWNRYAYVYNNPILFNDPSGHFAAVAALTLFSFAVPPLVVTAVTVVAVIAAAVVVGLVIVAAVDHFEKRKKWKIWRSFHQSTKKDRSNHS